MLRMTVPKMAQIRNDTVPYSVSDDKKALPRPRRRAPARDGQPLGQAGERIHRRPQARFPRNRQLAAFWDLNVARQGG